MHLPDGETKERGGGGGGEGKGTVASPSRRDDSAGERLSGFYDTVSVR